MNLPAVEAILFVASKPVSVQKISEVLECSSEDIMTALQTIRTRYQNSDSGLILVENGNEWQLVSRPDLVNVTERFIKAEAAGELTRAQLETLTVISYCGPITKPELEQIRGVNCSLIIRNLLVRGLVEEAEGGNELLPSFQVTIEYLRHLGVSSVRELPEYDILHQHEYLVREGNVSDVKS